MELIVIRFAIYRTGLRSLKSRQAQPNKYRIIAPEKLVTGKYINTKNELILSGFFLFFGKMIFKVLSKDVERFILGCLLFAHVPSS